MKKTRLQNLKKLPATNALIRRARELEPKKGMYGSREYFTYKLFLRCGVEDGILKVSIFDVGSLRMGNRMPQYVVFVDKKARQFITWDAVCLKWRKAKVDRLERLESYWGDCKYISSKDNVILKEYLEVSQDGYHGLRHYQEEIWEEERKKRHKKELDSWDQFLERTPKLPDNWNGWVDRDGMAQQYMFYDYTRRKKKLGYCSYCRREVPIEKPRHNQKGTCPACGHEIQFKARGRAGDFCTGKETVYLLQDCEGGAVVRQFLAYRLYQSGDYENTGCSVFEERRIYFQKDSAPRIFYYGRYKHLYDTRWNETDDPSKEAGYPGFFRPYCSRDYEGRVYGISQTGTECQSLARTGISEYFRQMGRIDPEHYLYLLKRMPYLEQLVKSGLFQLAKEVYREEKALEVTPSHSFAKALGIDRNRMKRLRENNGGSGYLKWLILEKRQGNQIPDDVIQYFAGQKITAEDLDFISGQMSVVRIKNYLERQSRLSGRPPKELLSTWRDYLSMSVRLLRDTSKELFYKPKDLVKSHDEAVKLCGDKDVALRAAEMVKKYPDVERICQSICEKYEFKDKDYCIVVPRRVEDIIYEGQALSHCISSSEIYYGRIQNKESFILFLRKADDPKKPYYTLEMEPDGTVRQKRTVGDKQNADYEDAVRFIKKWQSAVQRRLTKEDRELAKASAKLRIQELQELREKNARVWHGHLAGKLLADVLEADLLVAAQTLEPELDEAAAETEERLLAAA